MPFRVAFSTLGCKLNHYDTAALRGRLDESVFDVVRFKDEADAYVVNSCSVTALADRQSRQLVYRARRLNPDALIILTGCYATRAEAELRELTEIDHVIPGRRLEDVLPLLHAEALRKGFAPQETSHGPQFGSQSRPYLKVQDGCNAVCTYCVIPKTRGPLHSRPLDEILAELDLYGRRGVKEVILTGIHVGMWGRDLPGRPTFDRLLAELDAKTAVPRIRLSSLEPLELSDAVIEVVAGSEAICPHLHIPLQSGSDGVLARMRRPYDTARYRERIEAACAALPRLGLGIDVIVGFPGETEAEFAETVSFLESLPFLYLHVFPYSERPDTPAAAMPDQVPVHVRRERARRLIELAETRRRQSAEQQIGVSMPVLVECDRHTKSGFQQGFADTYHHVLIRSETDLADKIVFVKPCALYNANHHLVADWDEPATTDGER